MNKLKNVLETKYSSIFKEYHLTADFILEMLTFKIMQMIHET